MRHAWATLVLSIALGCGARDGSASLGKMSPGGMPLAELSIKGRVLRIEVAATEGDRTRGYRFRDAIPDGAGMLFVFPEARWPRFVMGGVTVPLSIAFIGEDGRIREVCDMRLSPDEITAGAFKVPYALEVPMGWYARQGIGAGDVVEGLAEVVGRFPAK